jgi:glycosyltransferase involved in cell wall biosynthesis
MDLKGVNILLDGYNLGLSKGTGIKRYGMTLIEALGVLGADINVLFSSRVAGNPIIDEVTFFESTGEPKNDDRLRLVGTIKDLLIAAARAPFGISQKAKRMSFGEVVLKSAQWRDTYRSANIFAVRDCYSVAIALYQIFGLKTVINMPQKVDIFHATCPLPIKIRKARKITTVHDLIPLRLPYTTLDDKNLFYKTVRSSIETSDLIITPSEHTKKDILDIFPTNPDKISVTSEPVSIKPVDEHDRIPLELYLRKYALQPNEYVLFVGAIEPKKNIVRLIDAYSLIDTDLPLVIAGKKAWLWEDEIGGRNIKNLRLLGHVSDEELRYLYSGARCFVFPSLYEGFGLGPLEAMTCGCPVIASNAASLPEVCGDAALYVDPYDINDIRGKIETLISDPQLRAKLSEAGKERAKLFSMENYVERLYEAYSKVL